MKSPESEFALGFGLRIPFRYIEAGSFQRAGKQVTLSKSFWMAKYPVTQREWEAVIGSNPSWWNSAGPTAPVEQVSWDDCQQFIEAIGHGLRLPTEAEWEYACNADSTRDYYVFAEPPEDETWCLGNSNVTTHPVGTKKANLWGLYDMHGNVWEWCSDWYDEYPDHDVTDPQGPDHGSYKVKRGGSWAADLHSCNAHIRKADSPEERDYLTGLRLVFSA